MIQDDCFLAAGNSAESSAPLIIFVCFATHFGGTCCCCQQEAANLQTSQFQVSPFAFEIK